METRGKIIVGVLIILVAIATGYLVFSFFGDKLGGSNRDGGETLSYKEPERFNLKIGEKKTLSLAGHDIAVAYLENSPKQKLKIVADGQEEIVEIEKKECIETTCLACRQLFEGGTECRMEFSVCKQTGESCEDVGTKKIENYTCEVRKEKTDCYYYWRQGEIGFTINPLIGEQEKNYHSDWETDLLAFSVFIGGGGVDLLSN